MFYDAKLLNPSPQQQCVIFTPKGFCLAVWNASMCAFITPYFMPHRVVNDVLFWQPIDIPPTTPSKWAWDN
jgi:hypothetical protein